MFSGGVVVSYVAKVHIHPTYTNIGRRMCKIHVFSILQHTAAKIYYFMINVFSNKLVVASLPMIN